MSSRVARHEPEHASVEDFQVLTQYEDIYPPYPTDEESDGANKPPSAKQSSRRRFSDGDESSDSEAERARLEDDFLTVKKRGKGANEPRAASSKGE